jgi:hypothetical protein
MLRCCVLFGVLTLANAAAAIPVTWEAQGVVRSVVLGPNADSSTAGALTDLGVEVGAPFSVSVSYDSDAKLYPDPYTGYTTYAVLITNMHVDFSHWSLSGPSGPVSGAGIIAVNQIPVPDDLGNLPRSSLVFAGDFPDTTYSFPESPNRNVTVDWGFLANDPSLFPNTSLPVNPPDLGALPPYQLDPTDTTTALGPVLYLTNDATYKVFDVAGEITSVRLVPEPGALALIALALLAVGYPRSR